MVTDWPMIFFIPKCWYISKILWPTLNSKDISVMPWQLWFLRIFPYFQRWQIAFPTSDYFCFCTVHDIAEYIPRISKQFFIDSATEIFYKIPWQFFLSTPKFDSLLILWPYCTRIPFWADFLLTRFKASKSKDWIFYLNFEIIPNVVYEIPIFHMSQKVD